MVAPIGNIPPSSNDGMMVRIMGFIMNTYQPQGCLSVLIPRPMDSCYKWWTKGNKFFIAWSSITFMRLQKFIYKQTRRMIWWEFNDEEDKKSVDCQWLLRVFLNDFI